MNFLLRAAFGNLAATFWFFPPVCKFLHRARGVRIHDSKSLFISRGVILDNKYPELIQIGPDVWLTQKVVVLTHASSSRFQQSEFGLVEKVAPVTIERGVFVGVGSIILPGVSIGEGSYIAAGSVVTTSIPSGVMAGGVPCKIIRSFLRTDGFNL